MQDNVPCKDCIAYAACNSQIKTLKLAPRNTISIILANKCHYIREYIYARQTSVGMIYNVEQMKETLKEFGVYDGYDY